MLLITLGEHGMMLFQKAEAPHYIPTKAGRFSMYPAQVTPRSRSLPSALSCGATPTEAAEIANHASAVVVGKLGTATVTREELIASFREDSQGG